MRILQQYQNIIFTGSIPPQMHIFINNRVKVALFIHGFIYNELSGAIIQAPPRIKAGALYLLSQWNFSKLFNRPRIKAGALYLLSQWNFSKLFNRIDLYICHSITTCEANKIHDNLFLFLNSYSRRKYSNTWKRVRV